MEAELVKIKGRALKDIQDATSNEELENIKLEFLGRKEGVLNNLLKRLASLPDDQKPILGKLTNELKQLIIHKIESKKKDFKNETYANLGEKEWIDVTYPGTKYTVGSLHPISQFINELHDVFGRMGFDIADGPEVDTDFYNFTALNIPADHPARDMQDTFWLKDMPNHVLRPHTSNMQIRYMEEHQPPLRIIAPGKVYRKDSDATHSPMFHQFEGLMVDTDISIAHLRATLIESLSELLQTKVNVRFRTSYFPFVEPGLEVDVGCVICENGRKVGGSCRVCKGVGWLEMGGAGMVHPQVLRNVKIDPAKYTGFAFGFGIERLLMIRHKIDDLRLFFQNDLRFLEQF